MKRIYLIALLLAALCSCDSVNNKVVPQTMVRIDLGTYALWNVYGVSGAGDYRIFDRAKRIPANFPYNANTFTGYGGVLLMFGFDIETKTYGPIAYDAACPYEIRPDVSVGFDASNFEAVCPLCHSRFNVFNGAGSPMSGNAVTLNNGMRRLKVRSTDSGGYVISSL